MGIESQVSYRLWQLAVLLLLICSILVDGSSRQLTTIGDDGYNAPISGGELVGESVAARAAAARDSLGNFRQPCDENVPLEQSSLGVYDDEPGHVDAGSACIADTGDSNSSPGQCVWDMYINNNQTAIKTTLSGVRSTTRMSGSPSSSMDPTNDNLAEWLEGTAVPYQDLGYDIEAIYGHHMGSTRFIEEGMLPRDVM